MAFSGMLRRVALVRNDVSEKLSASIIRVTRIGELRAALAITNNRCMLQRNVVWNFLANLIYHKHFGLCILSSQYCVKHGL
jgi:hypothetical protein